MNDDLHRLIEHEEPSLSDEYEELYRCFDYVYFATDNAA